MPTLVLSEYAEAIDLLGLLSMGIVIKLALE